jgi:hypothetical protein
MDFEIDIFNKYKKDYFNCYKFESKSQEKLSEFPRGIIGSRNYDISI